jgi:hypothetical protein
MCHYETAAFARVSHFGEVRKSADCFMFGNDKRKKKSFLSGNALDTEFEMCVHEQLFVSLRIRQIKT